jgi:hypothetical protein
VPEASGQMAFGKKWPFFIALETIAGIPELP